MAKVTISQIAKEAGVSKTAVSFAFNDPSQLSSNTLRHIREIAEQLGYTPDPIARSMTTRRTNALGLLLPQDIATALANPFYTQFIRGSGGAIHPKTPESKCFGTRNVEEIRGNKTNGRSCRRKLSG